MTGFELAQELLAFDNDTNVVDFATELGSGDFARFRSLVTGACTHVRSSEDLAEYVRLWNSQVRHYERSADRLMKFSIGGIVLAALGGSELGREVVPVVAPLMAMVLTSMNENGVRESQAMGAMADWANGALGSAAPGAVLISRMRRRVKGMKDP